MCPDNPLIYSETNAASSQPCPRQFLISIPRLISLSKTISVNALPDDANSQSLSKYLMNRDSCSCFEQSEASSSNIEKNWFSFIFLTAYYATNWTQGLVKPLCEVFEV